MLMSHRFEMLAPAVHGTSQLRGGWVILTLPTFKLTDNLLAIEVQYTFDESLHR